MRYWISYDLGLKGNYEELYAWLDKMKAKECGDSVATFETQKTREVLKAELSQILGEKARVYIFNKSIGGKFILGKRKIAPWIGFAEILIEGDEGEES